MGCGRSCTKISLRALEYLIYDGRKLNIIGVIISFNNVENDLLAILWQLLHFVERAEGLLVSHVIFDIPLFQFASCKLVVRKPSGDPGGISLDA